MKRTMLLTLLAALLGGCAVVPYGYDHRGGYHRDYYRDRGTWREPYYDGRRDDYRNDYYYRRYPGY
jgi:hypothetical protein